MASLLQCPEAEARAVLAFEIGLKATLAGAKLPLLTRDEHAALVALRTTALCLGLESVAAGIADLFMAETAAIHSTWKKERSPQEAG
jgi:hypothetical protein